jgi:hypothetical protein
VSPIGRGALSARAIDAEPSPQQIGQHLRRQRAISVFPDGEAGARKLAHFVEREIDRWLDARAVAVALPVEEPKAAAPAAPEIAPAITVETL